MLIAYVFSSSIVRLVQNGLLFIFAILVKLNSIFLLYSVYWHSIRMNNMEINSHRPELILKLNEQGVPWLDEKFLENTLLHEDVADVKVKVIATVGLGKGKSMLMNFLQRFMMFMAKGQLGDDCFDDNTTLTERSWNPLGSEGDTPGICMFSKVLPPTSSNDEKTMFIFLDTQGTTEEENSTIFALSTAMSSVLIYNLTQNVREEDLQQLEKFSEIAWNLSYDTEHKPFQKLLFLVRDWYRVSEANYGSVGGTALIEKKLKTELKNSQMEFVRNHIKAYFKDISCFLTPHPGLKVTNPAFDGKLSDMEADFKASLKELIPLLLDPRNPVKQIGGEEITARRWYCHLRSVVLQLENNFIPREPKPLNSQVITVDIVMSALQAGIETYLMGMKASFPCILDDHRLEEEHARCKGKAIEKFREKCEHTKMEEEGFFLEKYRNRLAQDIEDNYDWLKMVYKKIPQTVLSATNASEKKREEYSSILLPPQNTPGLMRLYDKIMETEINKRHGPIFPKQY